MSRPDTTDHVTPYDRLSWSDIEVERLLASGEHGRELAAYFGEQEYRELTRLAREAYRTPLRRDGARVIVVPGIMGSQLGSLRKAPLPNDILWIDPLDIGFGRLTKLRLQSGAEIVPLGVVLYSYLRLKLFLRIAGFETFLHHYDWRLGIDTLGAQLAERLQVEHANRLMVVAHSMGGLVARAALALPGTEKIERAVLLGTPNFGSFAVVQALRGTYAVVRKVARLDHRHSAESLSEEVFSTFPSLYHLLPMASHSGGIDLFDPAQWPNSGPRPRSELLESARVIEQILAPPDERFATIVGVDQETVTGLAREGDEFVYTVTRHGDGTVPTACAVLPGARTYFTPIAHSELTRDRRVAEAVADLLRTGMTRKLPTEWAGSGRAEARISDSELRQTHLGKVDWAALEPEERRVFLQNLNEPPKLRLKAPRKKAATLEIRVSIGSIVDANTEALVAAVFQDVRPAGAIAAIDSKLRGLILEMAERRSLPGEVGNVIAIPTHRRLPHAEQVLLAGIGCFDRLSGRAIEFAAEHVARLCVRSGIGSLASVPWGAGAGFSVDESCERQLRGYLRGLAATDAAHTLKQIVFCVRNRTAQRQLVSACQRVLSTERLPDSELVLREPSSSPARRSQRSASRVNSASPATVYLQISEQPSADGTHLLRTAVLTAGRDARVISESQAIPRERLERQISALDLSTETATDLRQQGEQISELILPAEIREALHAMRGNPLVVVHDAGTNRFPWEAICVRGWFAATGAGLSHRFAAEQLSLARFSETRRRHKELALLLVTDTTSDLQEAQREREQLITHLSRTRGIRFTVVDGKAATRSRLLAEFQSGAYDAVHVAARGIFDSQVAARSGLVCSDGVLTSRDLAELTQLPALMVFHAHDSAGTPCTMRERLDASHTIAEAFLRAGIASCVTTFRPSAVDGSITFAQALYSSLAKGVLIGKAIVQARAAMHARRCLEWASYIHYGDPAFRIKE